MTQGDTFPDRHEELLDQLVGEVAALRREVQSLGSFDREAAMQRLGVSRATLTRYIARGWLPRVARWTLGDIDACQRRRLASRSRR